MSETVLNAAGTSAAGTVAAAPMRTVNLKYFDWLYIFFGLAVLILGNYILYTATAGFNTTASEVISVVSVLLVVLGYLDYRNVKSKTYKIYIPVAIFVLGIVLLPLFTYEPYPPNLWTGLLVNCFSYKTCSALNAYDLTGISMGGFLLIFAALGEIYLMRKKPM
ncbi:MAG: hypothetical protein JRN06_11600 [Nitrososphaerota archaeon]|nr:hypothetical protein [Nitrososphaerota archaeon]